MAGRKIEDAKTARRCLAQVATSGLGSADWAARNGWDARSLHAWSLNLARMRGAKDQEPGLRLVELVANHAGTAADAPSAVAVASEPVYRVRVGRWSVDVGDDFVDATLARLIGVLSRC